MSDTEMADLVSCLAFEADPVESHERVEPAATDAMEWPVLGTLSASNAEWWVTGDKALPALSPQHRVLTPAQFWDQHGL